MEAKRDTRVIYEFGDFRLDAGELMLRRAADEVILPPKVVQTLIALVERQGQIVSKDDLMQAIWSDSIVEESNLSRYIHVIRATLGSRPDGKPYIETFRRRGYRFTSEVTIVRPLPTVSARVHDFPQIRGTRGAIREGTTGNIIAVPEWQRDVPDSKLAEPLQSDSRPAAVDAPSAKFFRPSLMGAVLLLLMGISITAYFVVRAPIPPLTERDLLLIADFENRTGDEIFDGTLKQGLAIQLQQSPFLSLVPDEQIRETLKLMRRPPDERLTRDTAKEVCLRRGLKAYIAGSISSVGERYLITLETVNAATGETLAGELVEVEGKEKTLEALSTVAIKLRRTLGESLASIEELATPLDVTTPSLEALQLFTLGNSAQAIGDHSRAETLFHRAIELDPEFALAYANLGSVYVGLGKRGETRGVVLRAYELRHRVSEFERLLITATYYRQVKDDFDKEIPALELARQLYPRKATPYTRLANAYYFSGNFEAALENAKQAIEISPSPRSYIQLARASLALNRYDEAEQAATNGLSAGGTSGEFHEHLVAIAFLQDDHDLLRQKLDALDGSRRSSFAYLLEAKIAAFGGQLKAAEQLFRKAIETAEGNELRADAAAHFRDMAETLAASGRCTPAREAAEMRNSKYSETPFLYSAPFVLAQCGNRLRALQLVDEELKNFPEGTGQHRVTVPVVRGLIALNRGQPANALEEFGKVPTALESRRGFLLWYNRARALLELNRGAQASLEFQKIIEHRGIDPLSPLYPLAYLGLARSRLIAGDIAGSRQAYERFLEIWKDADPNLAPLIEAKRELQNLPAS